MRLNEIFRCMVDAKLTNSRSKFMPRMQDDKLQFQIEAFRFNQDSRGLVSPLLYTIRKKMYLLEVQKLVTGVVPLKRQLCTLAAPKATPTLE